MIGRQRAVVPIPTLCFGENHILTYTHLNYVALVWPFLHMFSSIGVGCSVHQKPDPLGEKLFSYLFILIFLQPVFSFPNHLLCCRYLWPQVPISNYSYSTESPRPPHIGDTLSFSNNNAQDIFLFSLIISSTSSTFLSHYQKYTFTLCLVIV